MRIPGAIASRSGSTTSASSAPGTSHRAIWSQDVDGTTPGPGGNFVDGRRAATFGVLASYQSQLEFDVSYTAFDGAGRYNELTDRDFLAATIKYSF
jgi:hypothetical protein